MLLVILVLLAVFSIYQKKYPAVNKIINESKGKTVQLPTATNQPTSTQAISKSIFLEIGQPVNNSTVANAVVTLTGKTIADGSVFVNDQELKADINGNFSTSVTLEEGQNEIYVVAADDLGNSIEKDIIVNLESAQ